MNCKYLYSKFISKAQVASIKNSEIDPSAKVYEKCGLNKVKLGKYSYISYSTHITDATVGAFCSIGSNCEIGGGIHPLNMVSTSPVFLKGKSAVGKNFCEFIYNPSETVTIGNDVWIGDGCYVKAGVAIGDGAVIGAHAVVTHDVEPYSVMAGVPAKVLYKRFDEETIEKLLAIKWWNWDDDKLSRYAQYFESPEKLIEKIKEDRL